MPAFVKTPRFIISTIFLLWLIPTMWLNHNVQSVNVYYAPFFKIDVRAFWLITISATVGAVVALVVQFMWTHRASKKASSLVAA
jgi:hypothetical protein